MIIAVEQTAQNDFGGVVNKIGRHRNVSLEQVDVKTLERARGQQLLTETQHDLIVFPGVGIR